VDSRKLRRLSSAIAALGGLLALTAGSAWGASVSANWAGYVALQSTPADADFSSVSGTWRQPEATCATGHQTYSAVWVGLGGYSTDAHALEQVGTDADCSRSGVAVYKAWYELLPAGPVDVTLKVHPGDEMSASTTVKGHDVTLRIRDLSSGARFTITHRAARIDRSSAEWIVEAPSVCVNSDSCQPLPLTNFGEVLFSNATATAGSHTGTIPDPDWSSTTLELQQSAVARQAGATVTQASSGTLVLATPSPAAGSSGGFAVSWHEEALRGNQPDPGVLPGTPA